MNFDWLLLSLDLSSAFELNYEITAEKYGRAVTLAISFDRRSFTKVFIRRMEGKMGRCIGYNFIRVYVSLLSLGPPTKML